MGYYDDDHSTFTAKYTSPYKKGDRLDMKAMEDRWMKYHYRVLNKPELSPLLTKNRVSHTNE
jgi:hypothetical protein